MAENSPNPDSPKPDPDDAAPAQTDEQGANHAAQPEGDSGDGATSASPEQATEEALESTERAAERVKQEALGEEAAETETDHPAGDEVGPEAAPAGAESLNLPNFDAGGSNGTMHESDLHLLDDIDLEVKVELGRTEMYIEDVLRLNENSVVELNKAAGDPVDIFVNNRHVARGEVLVLNENFCVRISEIIKQPGNQPD